MASSKVDIDFVNSNTSPEVTTPCMFSYVGQYVLSPASAFWLFLASAFYELPTMYRNNASEIILNNIPAFFVASFMGIGVNYLSYLVIQYTSSLTMKILGTVRNIILIFYGVLVHGEVIYCLITYFLSAHPSIDCCVVYRSLPKMNTLAILWH